MIDFLKGWIMNVVAVVMTITIIEVIIPGKRFKKYIGVVSGFIILIAIAKPLFGFISSNADINALQIDNGVKVDKMQLKSDAKVLKDRQMKQVVSIYKKKLEANIKEEALRIKGIADVKVQTEINEDFNSKSFGDILKVYVTISKKTNESSKSASVRIDKIQINNSKEVGANKTVNDKTSKEIEDMLRTTMSIESEKVVITYR